MTVKEGGYILALDGWLVRCKYPCNAPEVSCLTVLSLGRGTVFLSMKPETILTKKRAKELQGANSYEIMAVWRKAAIKKGYPLGQLNAVLHEAQRGNYAYLCVTLGIPWEINF